MASLEGAFSGDERDGIARQTPGRIPHRHVNEPVDAQLECDKPTDCALVSSMSSQDNCSGTHHLHNTTIPQSSTSVSFQAD